MLVGRAGELRAVPVPPVAVHGARGLEERTHRWAADEVYICVNLIVFEATFWHRFGQHFTNLIIKFVKFVKLVKLAKIVDLAFFFHCVVEGSQPPGGAFASAWRFTSAGMAGCALPSRSFSECITISY